MSMDKVYIFRHNLDLSFIKVNPGDWVVIKPNLIKESKETDPNEWRSVITSPDIIEKVCCYVCEQLNGKGKVTICDAPQTDSSFAKIAERLNLYGIANYISNKYQIPVEIIDLRNEEWINEKEVIVKRNKLAGDPNGLIKFNLGKHSLFYKHNGEGRYYGADYDTLVVNQHHHGSVQEYLICATPILADVFINLPKLKTHKKTGVTLSLKNLVGINADKNWLPHHTEGDPQSGGDQYPIPTLLNKLEGIAVRFVRKLALNLPYFGPKISIRLRQLGTTIMGDNTKTIRSGNWYGNDTTWRMVLDLNRCLLYGDATGSLSRPDPKRYYSLIDGVIGMEGMGPMQGDPIHSKVIIGGSDPVTVDMVAARVMGFDWRKIPVIREAFNIQSLPITKAKVEDVIVFSDVSEWNGRYIDIENAHFLQFKPHYGWIGHIEYEKRT